MLQNTIAAATLMLLATSPLALAGPGHGDSTDFGNPGTAEEVDRVIEVDMGEMFFSLDELEVEANETIRFVIRNAGDFVHEFNLGTERMHAAHESEMLAMMDRGILEADRINHRKMKAAKMMHDDPNSVLLEPGEEAEIVWTFDGDRKVEVSCNLPGHRDSGMTMPIVVVNRRS